MTVRMLDAEMIDTLPGTVFAGAQVLAVYGSSFGAHPETPARTTPAAWVRARVAQGWPVWVIYFPGADPASALTETRQLGGIGVVCDVEARWENDPLSRTEAANFGGFFAGKLPRVVYCHNGNVRDLAQHYDGQWWPWPLDLQPAPPNPPPPRCAVQRSYQGSYDASYCDAWFAHPSEATDLTPAESAQLNQIWVALFEGVPPGAPNNLDYVKTETNLNLPPRLAAIEATLAQILAAVTAGTGGPHVHPVSATTGAPQP